MKTRRDKAEPGFDYSKPNRLEGWNFNEGNRAKTEKQGNGLCFPE